MITYRSINEEMKRKYGQKVYRVSLNAGLSCPNRDGKISTGGCIFCSEGGSGDFASPAHESIATQLAIGKEVARKKAKNCNLFIAYFQAFTNTYGPIDYLRKIFYDAIEDDEVVILSIATRPDCISEEVLELLSELNAIKPVWIELGLQSIHENTAKMINRGYELAVYDKALKELQGRGLEVITHVILGLPGETTDDMVATVDYVCKSGTNGIKLQLLHVLKGTKLADMYQKDAFHMMSMEEYLDVLKRCVAIIPPSVIVHRLTGDGPKSLLIEPQWTADKKRVINEMKKHLTSV